MKTNFKQLTTFTITNDDNDDDKTTKGRDFNCTDTENYRQKRQQTQPHSIKPAH